MSSLDLRAASVNISGTVGDDLSITVTVVDSNGDAIDLSGYTTIQADVLRNGTSVATFTDSLGGAGNNVITLTLTDVQTTSIGNERGLTWSLEVDADGSSVTQWLAGEFRLYTAGTPGASGSTSVTLTASGAVSLTASIATGTQAALDGRYALLTNWQRGSGAPNGVVTGSVGDRYVDTAATLGARVWYKASGTATNTGWLVAEGDTGWRDISSLVTLAGSVSVFRMHSRRINNVVYHRISMSIPSTAAGSTQTLWTESIATTLGTGWRPRGSDGDVLTGAGNNGGTSGFLGWTWHATVDTAASRVTPLGASATTAAARISYATTDAWPTSSLPGTAVP